MSSCKPWSQVDFAGLAIDHNAVAEPCRVRDALCRTNQRQPHRAGNDRHVRGRGRIFEHKSHQPLAAIVEQFGGPHCTRDDDRVKRQLLRRGFSGEMSQQTARQIVQIVQAFAQDRIVEALHPHPHFVLHALDGGFCGQSGPDRIAHALAPTLVVREQAIGFDDFAPLAGEIEFAGVEHLVDRVAQGADSVFQPRQFFRRIVGDHALDQNARFMQNNAPHCHALGETLAMKDSRPVDAQFRLVQLGDIEQPALRDDFRQHHRNGLQRFDFLFRV